MPLPYYILATVPTQAVRFKAFFEGGPGSIRSLLEDPPRLRRSGWDIYCGDRARIVKAEFLEVSLGDDKLVRLYEDGTMVVRGLADESFLGWGKTHEEGKYVLNPLAIIEFIFSTVHVYSLLLSHFERQPEVLQFEQHLKNAKTDSGTVYLKPGHVEKDFWRFFASAYPAKTNELNVSQQIAVNEITGAPAHGAYRIVEKLFAMFGCGPEEIPYTIVSDGKKAIDVERIKNI
jgi:hypothetical protein